MNRLTPLSSILFICMGNICRSPAGENVMRKLLQDAGLADQVRCDSAGTLGYHSGASPDSRMHAAGQKRGLPMTGKARQVTRVDLSLFDLILAMDDDNYRELQTLATEQNRHKIKLFCEYCVTHRDNEVPDPYYGGPEGFEHVLDLLEDGCTQILQVIKGTHEI
ncbi:MAG: low molecular weight protein-tyrosine-phosphatase [Steroidobacteraceae bacterium]